MKVGITFEVNSCYECPFYIKDDYSERCIKNDKFTSDYNNSIPEFCPIKNKKDKSLYKRPEDIKYYYIEGK